MCTTKRVSFSLFYLLNIFFYSRLLGKSRKLVFLNEIIICHFSAKKNTLHFTRDQARYFFMVLWQTARKILRTLLCDKQEFLFATNIYFWRSRTGVSHINQHPRHSEISPKIFKTFKHTFEEFARVKIYFFCKKYFSLHFYFAQDRVRRKVELLNVCGF